MPMRTVITYHTTRNYMSSQQKPYRTVSLPSGRQMLLTRMDTGVMAVCGIPDRYGILSMPFRTRCYTINQHGLKRIIK